MSVLLFSQRFSGGGDSLPDETVINPETFSSKKKKLRRIMIREELITLTGDPCTAAILGQFLYWSQKVPDFDLFIEEERDVSSKNRPLQHGWFHKTTQEFLQETMLCMSITTFRRYLSNLTDRGWVQTRLYPQIRGDRTTQYRVNLRKLCNDLQEHGYSLPGFAAYGVCPQLKQSVCEEQNLKEASSAADVESDSSKGRSVQWHPTI